MRQKVFLSYSHVDQDWVRYLHQSLVTLAGHGHDIFWDQQIPASDTWNKLLEREVTEADHMVLVATPEAIASADVQKERNLFVQKSKLERLYTIQLYEWQLPQHLTTKQLLDCVEDKNVDRAIRQLAAFVRGIDVSTITKPLPPAPTAHHPRLPPSLFAKLLELLHDELRGGSARTLGALTFSLAIEDRNWHQPFEHAIEKANAAIRIFEKQEDEPDPTLRTLHLLDRLERDFVDSKAAKERLHQLRRDIEALRQPPAPVAPPEPPEPPRETPPAATQGFAAQLNDYRAAMTSSWGILEFAGFETTVQVPIRLHQLWVPLRTVPDRSDSTKHFANAKEAAATIGEAEARDLDLAAAFRLAHQQDQRGLVVLGDPGSGKTTLMRHTGHTVLGNPAAFGLAHDVVPILLPLRQLEAGDLDHGLERLLRRMLPKHRSLPADFAAALLQRGRLLVLLDGLDEVPEDQRQKVVRWIGDALRQREDCWFVVTCRYAGYTNPFDEKFLRLHLQPMDFESSKNFISKWYQAVESTLRPDSGPTKADEAAADLIDRLFGKKLASNRLLEMAANPMLLTNVCLVHRSRSRHLPEARHRLYEECLNTLLEHWPLLRQQLHVRSDQGKVALQPVAHHLHEQRKAMLPGDELQPPLRDGLKLAGIDKDAGEFLRQLRDQSGLLTGWSGDRYGFLHLGFQEYLTAREIGRRAMAKFVAGSGGEEELARLARHFGEDWWQEVTLLFLASEPELVGKFLLQAVRQPGFAADHGFLQDCLRESARKDAAPFVQWLREQGHLPTHERASFAHMTAALQAIRIWAPELAAQLDRDLPWLAGTAPSKATASSTAARHTTSRHKGIPLIEIPAGSFVMGSDQGEGGGNDERPKRTIRFAKPFWLARTAVTNQQYRTFVEATGHRPPTSWSLRSFNAAEQPVVDVSWEDAQAFCRWAGLRLPSEAEWEYACRAGTTTQFSFGEDITTEQVNYDGNYPYAKGKKGEYRHRTVPVGSLPANAWGLHEMHGNVWEWCEDWKGDYEKAPTDGSAQQKDQGSGRRVLRGGSWVNYAWICRSASRSGGHPRVRADGVGFRPASSSP